MNYARSLCLHENKPVECSISDFSVMTWTVWWMCQLQFHKKQTNKIKVIWTIIHISNMVCTLHSHCKYTLQLNVINSTLFLEALLFWKTISKWDQTASYDLFPKFIINFSYQGAKKLLLRVNLFCQGSTSSVENLSKGQSNRCWPLAKNFTCLDQSNHS